MTFHQFSQLPLELQTEIWETCTCGPCIHIFDVCFPSRDRGGADGASGNAGRDIKNQMLFERYRNTVFLDRLEGSSKDPSMYHVARSLSQTCRLAAWSTQAMTSRNGSMTVSLPGRGGNITVPKTDVLMLRFRDTNHGAHDGAADAFQSCIGRVLRSQWSAELASTLQGASKVALDVAEGWVFSPHDTLGWDEITHLASTLHRHLEVLYLVDTCAGRCGECSSRQRIKAGDLQQRGALWKRLDQDGKEGEHERPGDVIRAVGRRYVEVFDLEALGWHECNPTYGFAFLMNNAIRLHQHQGGESVFQGIRVLMVEDDE